MNKRITILSLAAIAATAVVTSVTGYTTIGRWAGNNTTMRAAAVSFPSGAWRTSLQTVVDRYYNNPSEFWFTQSWGDTSVGMGNGQSETWFSADSKHSPAVCYTWYDWLGRISEADVVFYNGVSYTTSMNKTSITPYGGSYSPFQTTAMHEYGHAAGLGHEDDEYNIMGQDWDHIYCNGSTCRSGFGEDAADGLVALYGRASGGSFEDVGATLFKWSGRSGEYSKHDPCVITTTGGGSVSNSSYNGQRRYNVNRGSSYKAQFTYENNGETTRTINVGYYISTNSTISTGDTRIATTSMTLGRANVYTWSKTVTIPSNLTRGSTYYLGVIVDYDNALSEVDGNNNQAYHIIKIN